MFRFEQCGLESLDSGGAGERSPEVNWMVWRAEGEASREQVDIQILGFLSALKGSLTRGCEQSCEGLPGGIEVCT